MKKNTPHSITAKPKGLINKNSFISHQNSKVCIGNAKERSSSNSKDGRRSVIFLCFLEFFKLNIVLYHLLSLDFTKIHWPLIQWVIQRFSIDPDQGKLCKDLSPQMYSTFSISAKSQYDIVWGEKSHGVVTQILIEINKCINY